MTRRSTTAQVARLLGQRAELGEHELVLEGMTREQALALARAASVSVAAPTPALPRGAGAARR
ncbi:MAG: hypothetical protein FJ207_12260, partial [Gemmatimonadetes bacterium]|nr:hypothetical protein [Gemmatimonadota bacterium]